MVSVSFARFEREVLEVYELKAPATLCMMRQVLREFGQVEGVKRAADLRPVTVARWIKAHAGRAPATRDKLLRSLKAACSIGVASGYLRGSPVAALGRLADDGWGDDEDGDEGDGPRRHHSVAEVRRVLELATAEASAYPDEWKPARLEALAHTYALAALRKREALYLQRRDVDLEARILRVRRHRDGKPLKTKASAAPVPIAPDLVEVLARWLPRCGSPWVFPGVTRVGPWDGGPPGYKPLDEIKALGKRAGVEGLTILSFRHSFATHAKAWGIGALMLRSILRHTTLRTQQSYLHDDPDDLRAAAEAVTYRARPPRAIA